MSVTFSVFAENKWHRNTVEDLTFIHKQLQTNTPGYVDTKNQAYRILTDVGYKKALNAAKEVQTKEGYFYVVMQYVNAFKDEDFNVLINTSMHFVWTDFLVAYRNGAMYVSPDFYDKSNKNIPPIDAKLMSCDQMPVNELMEKYVFQYSGTSALQADWYAEAPYLFARPKNPFLKPIEQCLFSYKGKTTSYKLHWSELSLSTAVQLDTVDTLAYTYYPQYRTHKLKDEVLWVTIPSFAAKNTAEAYYLNELAKLGPSWRMNKLIVFDLRGNTGGNPEYGYNILSSLYGKAYVDEHLYPLIGDSYAQWRISEPNYQYLTNEETKIYDKKAKRLYYDVADKMEPHLETKLDDYVTHRIEAVNGTVARLPSSLYRGSLIVLTDGRCGSSCLTFVSEALAFPNAFQAGVETNGDTFYTESRMVEMPSGVGKLYFPMKVMRNRSFGSNVPFKPTFIFRGDINDTKALRAWIVEIYKENINKRYKFI